MFKPVGKKLLGRHALGGDLQVCFCKIWSKNKICINRKKLGTNKTGRKSRLPPQN